MEKKRYHLIDEARGFAVLCMVVFHAFFSVSMVMGFDWADRLIRFFSPAEPFFAALFVFISGISSTLSSSNLKNALKLSIVAVGITVVTLIGTKLTGMEMSIYFGVIHMLACCLFLAAVLDKFRMRLPFLWIIVALALFLLGYDLVFGYPFLPKLGLSSLGVYMPYGYEGKWWLLPFGFPQPSTGAMADYFPIIPWVFMFIAGRASACLRGKGVLPRFAEKSRIKPFSFIGRHALIIYILHQPVIFGACYAVQFMLGGSI